MTTVDPPTGRDDLECRKNHCHAKKRGESGGLCCQAAGWGTNHPGTGNCKLHMGSTTAHRRKATAEIARQAAATYGLPIEVDPAQALLEEVHRTAGHVAWLGAVVAEMERRDLVWGIAEETDSTGPDGGSSQTKSRAVPNVWLQLYRDERKHLASVCRDALGADAAGRVAGIFEQIGGRFIDVFDRALDRADLNTDQRRLISGVLLEELQTQKEATSERPPIRP